jgi:toxin-antitoxin system, antitoxin component, hicB family
LEVKEMTKKYLVIIKREKNYNIVRCKELNLTIKVKQDESTLDFIEKEICDYLIDKILKGEEISEGINDLEKIPRTLKNETVFVATFDLELEVAKRRNKLIKKTLTLPEYLNVLGMRENLNFSQILAEGLREKLKIK